VGIVAPAAAVERPRLEAGCALLERMGYKPFYLESIFERDLYFAGTLGRRVRELEEMFEREEVRAIVCARGGYGCNYLLGKIDLRKLAGRPKPLIGYSDVTTLLTWLSDTLNMVTFHGPMLVKDFASGSVHAASWLAALGGEAAWELAPLPGARALIPGHAQGMLYGGCLSMLAASLGTPYEIQTADTVLFVEDVGVKPYQLDRMLMQLKLARKLKNVRGLIFGEMLECAQPGDQTYSLAKVILRVVGDLGVPVALGASSGHVFGENVTLPMGVRVKLSVDESVSLRFLEPATQPTVTGARRTDL